MYNLRIAVTFSADSILIVIVKFLVYSDIVWLPPDGVLVLIRHAGSPWQTWSAVAISGGIKLVGLPELHGRTVVAHDTDALNSRPVDANYVACATRVALDTVTGPCRVRSTAVRGWSATCR